MSAYLVGTVRISDPDRYGAYVAAIKGLSAQFGGEPIVSGPVKTVVEGDGQAGERVVVTRFPSEADAAAYLQSPAYLDAKALRVDAAIVELRVVVA